jgi:hypothetical protein
MVLMPWLNRHKCPKGGTEPGIKRGAKLRISIMGFGRPSLQVQQHHNHPPAAPPSRIYRFRRLHCSNRYLSSSVFGTIHAKLIPLTGPSRPQSEALPPPCFLRRKRVSIASIAKPPAPRGSLEQYPRSFYSSIKIPSGPAYRGSSRCSPLRERSSSGGSRATKPVRENASALSRQPSYLPLPPYQHHCITQRHVWISRIGI